MIQLRLLGTFELLDARGVRMDAALRRPKIAALFWPELSAERARAALRVTLTRLRDDLGADVILTAGADEIAVDAARILCDAVAFDDALAKGDLAGADALYRGPFLDGIHIEGTGGELEQWISAERRRVREALEKHLLLAASNRHAVGARHDSVAITARAVEISPDDEAAHRAYIAALIDNGDRAGALRAYDELRAALARDYGLAPAPETEALVHALRSNGTPPATANGVHVVPQQNGGVTAPASRLPALALTAVVAIAAAFAAIWGREAMRANAADPVSMQWRMAKEVAGPHPRGRIEPGGVLDSSGAMIVFGGQDYVEDPQHSSLMNDLWRLRGLRTGETAVWTRLDAKGALPSPRWMFGMASDPARDLAIVHGGALGFSSPCANDTWVLSHASGIGATPRWSRVRVRGAKPPGRAGIRALYDPHNRRLIFFGGHDCVSLFASEVWVLAFDDSTLASGAWTQLHPDSSAGAPVTRSAYGATYDSAANRLIVFGGAQPGKAFADLWTLDHANGLGGTPTWHQTRCSGVAPALGSPSLTIDAARGWLLIFGGVDVGGDYHRDLWRVIGWNHSGGDCHWDRLSPVEPAPAARGGAIAMFDPASKTTVFFGGQYGVTAFSDTWLLANR